MQHLGKQAGTSSGQHNRADHTDVSTSDLAPRESEQESKDQSLLRAHPGGVNEGY